MHKQNIADFILYDMKKNHVTCGFGIDAGLISKVVEGWNQNIYVAPNENLKFYRRQKCKAPTVN